MSLKIIFFGSDEFAVTQMRALTASKHKVLLCVTQPDKPKDRHYKIKPTSAKEFADKKGIDILQPQNLRDKPLQEKLKSYGADMFVVAAYGQIFPQTVLDIPRIFCVNIHTSLLPKYRGAAPINHAIINGEQQTGVTLFKLEKKVDAGPILSQRKVKIDEQDNAVTLKEKLSVVGAELLVHTLDEIEAGAFTLKPQDSKKATYAPKLKKEDGRIHFGEDGTVIHNLIRGLLPWPGAYCLFGEKRLKILKSQVMRKTSTSYRPGKILEVTKEGFIIATKTQGLLIERVHLESSKEMDAKSFLAGHQLKTGFLFT